MKKYLGLLAIALFVACHSSTPSANNEKDSVSNKEISNAPVFKKSEVATIYVSYLKLKDALVASDSNKAKAEAKTLSDALKNYNGCENTGVISDKIADAKDLAIQRKEFTALSKDVIALFKNSDLVSGSIYVQHCPMANKGDGGDWIANEAKIKNPYYGDEMLECGSVIQEIKAKQ